MRTFISSLVVVSAVAFVSGQTPASADAQRAGLKRIEQSHIRMAGADITAAQVQRTADNTIELSGAVRIEVGTTIITADEATVRTATGDTPTAEWDLRGNVHVTTRR